MIFATMAIPLKYQHRVLFWGIFGALILRAVFIFAGSALISKFWWLLLVFGVFLVYTGIKVIRHRDDEGEESAQRGVGLLRRFMPVTDKIEGHTFFTRIDGKRAATPLFAALVVVEVTDVIFAVDSVPAILAVSREPFLVFASNAFAILGLRAMYFLLANAKEKFHFLSHALGGILVFVGLKMALSHWIHLNTYVSLVDHPRHARRRRSSSASGATGSRPQRPRQWRRLAPIRTSEPAALRAARAGARRDRVRRLEAVAAVVETTERPLGDADESFGGRRQRPAASPDE